MSYKYRIHLHQKFIEMMCADRGILGRSVVLQVK